MTLERGSGPGSGSRSRWVVAVVCVLLTGCGSDEPGARKQAGPVLDLAVEVEPGQPVTELVNRGTAAAHTDLVVSGGAAAHAERSPSGTALRLPAYAAGEQRFAVVRVWAEDDDNPFAPRFRDFVVSADLRLDDVSSGTSVDNGDNVVQRGLFEGGQYKIQLDHLVPSCRVAGTAGAVLVTGDRLEADRWYRVSCARQGEEVELAVAPLTGEGAGRPLVTRQSGSTGSVEIPADVPLSVGGKLGVNGTIVESSSDQFNGSLTRVRLSYPS